MTSGDALSTVAVLILAGVLLYRVSFMKKKLWHITLQQMMLLVAIPAVLFPMMYAYLMEMIAKPMAAEAFISDKVLVNLVLMSLVYAYGAIAIHAVTRIMSDEFHKHGGEEEVIEINKFFHTTFSHNLGVGGILLAFAGITLLEMNHVADALPVSLLGGVIRGMILGTALALTAYNYTRYTTGDVGRWYDLRFTFGVAWVVLVLVLYGIKRFDPRLTEYQLLLPSLLSFSVMVLLSLVLVVRRVKRGGWRVVVRWERLRRLVP